MTFGGGGGGFGGGSSPPDTIGSFQLQLHALGRARPGRRDLPEHPRHGGGHPGPRSADRGAGKRPAGRQGDQPARREHELCRPRAGRGQAARLSSRTIWATPSTSRTAVPAPGIDWQVTIDRVAAAKYGIGVRELSPYVQLVTSGVKLGSYRPDDCDRRTRHPGSPAEGASAPSTRSTRCASSPRRAWCRSATSSSARPCPRSPTSARRNGVYSMTVAANLAPGVNSRRQGAAGQGVGEGADRRPARSRPARTSSMAAPTSRSPTPCVHRQGLRRRAVPDRPDPAARVQQLLAGVGDALDGGHVAGRRDARAC